MNKDAKERYKLLDRYILMKYLKTFLMAMALIIVIVITFDVSEKLDEFLGNHAPINLIIFQYYGNFIPQFVNMYSPLFIFISVIFFTSKMAGNTEVIAILGSGISYRRLLQPYLHGSILVALLVFVLGNFVLPITNRGLSEFENTYIKTIHRSYYSTLHFQPERNVQVFAEGYDTRQRSAIYFQRDTYNEENQLVERLSTNNIINLDSTDVWSCRNITRHTFLPEERMERIPLDTIALRLLPEDFDHASADITTMNSLDLMKHIRKMKLRGSGLVVASKIELYQRLLNPLAIIIMTLIGVAISSRKVRGGIGVHLAIGISIAFGFIVFMKISTVFAINGSLNPFISVLLPQLMFGLAALYLIKNAPK